LSCVCTSVVCWAMLRTSSTRSTGSIIAVHLTPQFRCRYMQLLRQIRADKHKSSLYIVPRYEIVFMVHMRRHAT
jgi:hypothetical protein